MTVNKPVDVINYCPSCGSNEITKHEDSSIECSLCGFHLYVNPAAAVAAIIIDQKKHILFTVRAHEPMKGMLDLPGGFVDPGETAEEALQREIKEELNISVKIMSYFASFPNRYLYKGIAYDTIDIAFVCSGKDLEGIKAMDEIDDIVFIKPSDVNFKDIGFDSIRKIVKTYIRTHA